MNGYLIIFICSLIGCILSFLIFIYGLKNDATILEIVGRVISPIFGFFIGSSLYLYLCN